MYIINLSIAFSPEDNVLYLVNNEDSLIKISSPAGRLLQELIKNNGSTLTRKWLLKTVWEDYGFSGSNNNLNNYTSELRRAITSLDSTAEVIFTLPKVGLKLNAKIDIFIDGKERSIVKEEIKNNKKSMRSLILFSIPIALIFSIFAYIYNSHLDMNYDKHSFLIKIDGCTIYSLDDFNTVSKPQLIDNISKAVIEEKNINCNRGMKLDVFYKSMESISGFKGIRFIGVCSRSNSPLHEYDSCYSIVKL